MKLLHDKIYETVSNAFIPFSTVEVNHFSCLRKKRGLMGQRPEIKTGIVQGILRRSPVPRKIISEEYSITHMAIINSPNHIPRLNSPSPSPAAAAAAAVTELARTPTGNSKPSRQQQEKERKKKKCSDLLRRKRTTARRRK